MKKIATLIENSCHFCEFAVKSNQSILYKNRALAETLSGDGPFTVFAPTNEAFEKLPQSVVDALMADPEALKKVLLYHVIPAEIKSSDITEDDVSVASAEGTKLRVNTYMKRFYYDVSLLKFIYSEKATKFCEIFPLLLTYVL